MISFLGSGAFSYCSRLLGRRAPSSFASSRAMMNRVDDLRLSAWQFGAAPSNTKRSSHPTAKRSMRRQQLLRRGPGPQQAEWALWVSQDQRNTLRTRFRCQVVPRMWVALGAQYGSGLPFEFVGTPADAVAEFGQAIVNRVNFDAGRIRPSYSVDATVGAEMWKKDNFTLRLQGDVRNINNRLNLIDFAGLFSGNAIAPPRSYAIRLQTSSSCSLLRGSICGKGKRAGCASTGVF